MFGQFIFHPSYFSIQVWSQIQAGTVFKLAQISQAGTNLTSSKEAWAFQVGSLKFRRYFQGLNTIGKILTALPTELHVVQLMR